MGRRPRRRERRRWRRWVGGREEDLLRRRRTERERGRMKRRDACWLARERPARNEPNRESRRRWEGEEEWERETKVRRREETRRLLRAKTSAPTLYSHVRGDRAKRTPDSVAQEGELVRFREVRERRREEIAEKSDDSLFATTAGGRDPANTFMAAPLSTVKSGYPGG